MHTHSTKIPFSKFLIPTLAATIALMTPTTSSQVAYADPGYTDSGDAASADSDEGDEIPDELAAEEAESEVLAAEALNSVARDYGNAGAIHALNAATQNAVENAAFLNEGVQSGLFRSSSFNELQSLLGAAYGAATAAAPSYLPASSTAADSSAAIPSVPEFVIPPAPAEASPLAQPALSATQAQVSDTPAASVPINVPSPSSLPKPMLEASPVNPAVKADAAATPKEGSLMTTAATDLGTQKKMSVEKLLFNEKAVGGSTTLSPIERQSAADLPAGAPASAGAVVTAFNIGARGTMASSPASSADRWLPSPVVITKTAAQKNSSGPIYGVAPSAGATNIESASASTVSEEGKASLTKLPLSKAKASASSKPLGGAKNSKPENFVTAGDLPEYRPSDVVDYGETIYVQSSGTGYLPRAPQRSREPMGIEGLLNGYVGNAKLAVVGLIFILIGIIAWDFSLHARRLKLYIREDHRE